VAGLTMLTLLRLPVFLLGVMLLFIGERFFAAETWFVSLRVAAFAVMLAGFGMTVMGMVAAGKRGHREEAKCWRLAILWQLAIVAGCGIYIWYSQQLGTKAVPDTFMLRALLVLWLLPLTIGTLAAIGIEWALRESGRGPLAEHHRVARTAGAWTMVGILLAILACVNFAGNQRDKSFDWSYLKVTSPSESTRTMVRNLTKDMKIGVFFPPGNEVRQFVEQYFDQLAAAEPRIKLSYHDKDMDPTLAEQFRVSKNGQIVLELDGKQERIDTGLKIASARATLRKLDGEFQKQFMALTAERKTAYFTRGHGEMSWLASGGDDGRGDPLRLLRVLEGDLRDLNYGLRLFGLAEGSAREVPEDAALVAIIGPTQPFLPEEVEALKAYLERGGKILAMLDIESPTGGVEPLEGARANDPLLKMLAEIGIRYDAVPLANDRNYVRATNSPADAWFLFTNSFTSHESVSVLARHEERVAMLLFKSGSLAVTPELGKWQNFETVRSLTDTFQDVGRDFRFDEGKDKRNAWVLGSASIRKAQAGGTDPGAAARVVVFADATAASDGLAQNGPNRAFMIDALRWLAGESKVSGLAETEEDVKIRHTRKEDAVWFYGTVIAMPLLVLGAGFAATRRGRSKAPSRSKRKANVPGSPPASTKVE